MAKVVRDEEKQSPKHGEEGDADGEESGARVAAGVAEILFMIKFCIWKHVGITKEVDVRCQAIFIGSVTDLASSV